MGELIWDGFGFIGVWFVMSLIAVIGWAIAKRGKA